MSRTPNTPFIPPLPATPDDSPGPEHPPVIPTGTPWNQSIPLGGNYAPYASPYSAHSPFIPSPLVTPGVIPGIFSPPQLQPKVNHLGVSEDFTGYPGPTIAQPVFSPNYPMSAFGQNPFGQHPNSPYGSQAGPYGGPQSAPWQVPPQRLPPGPQGFPPFPNYGPPPPPTGPPPHMMGGPPPLANPPPQAMNGQGWQAHAYPPFYGGGPEPGPWMAQQPHFGQQPYRVPPEPPAQIFDRMDPFTEGKGYGAVLTPFLIRVVNANVIVNPLISPLPEDGSDRVHLAWNMLFPTSTVQRSSDPSHISWSNGRNAPATFPRISSLRLVSDTIPWVLDVKARDVNIGITCGEVIDSIADQLARFSDKHDYNRLTPNLRHEVGSAYRRNRSREPGVPGGQLGQGLKRLDFLRQDTMFAGIEVNDRIVKRVCGDVLPCVFVLKCSQILPMTRQEVEDRQVRLGHSPGNRPRSRANSNTQITVQPPSTTGSQDDLHLHP